MELSKNKMSTQIDRDGCLHAHAEIIETVFAVALGKFDRLKEASFEDVVLFSIILRAYDTEYLRPIQIMAKAFMEKFGYAHEPTELDPYNVIKK